MNKFTISNIAGGDLRTFTLIDGQISGRACKHANKIGYGGPMFEGDAANIAAAQYEQYLEDQAFAA